MEKFVILADFLCDLSPEIREYIGMTDYARGHIHLADGNDIPGTLDWDHIQREEFYKMLSDKKNNITTSPSNSEEYYELFDSYLSQGCSVISISISAVASGTFSFVETAAARVNEKYSDVRVYCVNSMRMSGGIGLLVIQAYMMKNEGKSFDEIVAWLEDNKCRVHQMGPIDDLFFVARRGRITMGKAIMGSFAGVKPMGDCDSTGYVKALTKVKGINKAIDVTVEYVKETAVDIENQYVIVVHSDREEYAKTLKEKIEAQISPKKVFFSDVFPGSGANIGPGMIAVYYFGNPISDDLAYEKATINRILGK